MKMFCSLSNIFSTGLLKQLLVSSATFWGSVSMKKNEFFEFIHNFSENFFHEKNSVGNYADHAAGNGKSRRKKSAEGLLFRS